MNLFYAPELTQFSKEYIFNKDESRHISKVLRKKKGEKLFLTNGKGGWFEAEIIDNDIKKTLVRIVSHRLLTRRNYRLHVAIAPTKSNERFEWFLEKATEIGIDEITPLLTEHSERKKINKDRYNKILISAMKQSLQAYLPKLNDFIKLNKFLEQLSPDYKRFLAFCQSENFFKNSLSEVQDVLVIIGPEGGFSKNEVESMLTHAFIPVRLSATRLRTETAGLLSVATVHLKLD